MEYILTSVFLLSRFGLFVHPVISSPIKLHVCHPAPSKVQNIKNLINDVTSSVGNRFSLLYPFKKMSLIQFPETRLVQYDCGKVYLLFFRNFLIIIKYDSKIKG